ncbi:tandem-95 repeat protein [Luteolibacter arcticus]|uniref:Tandem-95 repeat protein n=1 Tax=Luteolibacter arcticus TaxID=1581411 RepID=A0ABT3GK52_9BACT|nr:tandem-95 repeat protein [Luteolibacter arcticus]MCW1923903.1 tandem-95 repeat protein [Luteolibacter arcticus]
MAKSIFHWAGLVGVLACGGMAVNAAPMPDDVKLVVTVEGQAQTLHLHRRSVRSSDFKLLTWDSANGYVEMTTDPEVRSFRGTIEGNSNAIVLAGIDSHNNLYAYCYDLEYSQNLRWTVSVDVSSQLVTPLSPATMPSQTIAAPRAGSTGPPLLGPKVPTGTSHPVGTPAVAVNYGDIVEYDLGADLLVVAYNGAGQHVEDTLLAFERNAMIYEQMLLRSCLTRLNVTTVVVRKDSFPGGSTLSAWNQQPLLTPSRWDCLWVSEGNSSNSVMGHGVGVGYGVLYHENTHNWNASHLGYQGDTQGGNWPSIGPITSQRMLGSRKNYIDAGWFPKALDYLDPLHPYTHVDAARVTMDTPQDIDVLANDWDSNGDTLIVSDWTPTTRQGGTVTRNTDGSLRYVPASGFVGKDMIAYSAEDSSTMHLKTKELVHIEVVNNDLMAEYKFDEDHGIFAKNNVTGAHATTDASILNGNFANDSVPAPLGRGVFSPGTVSTESGNDESGYGGIRVGTGKVTPTDLTLDTGTPFESSINKNGCGFDILDGNYTFETWYRCDDYALGNATIASKSWGGEQNYGWNMYVYPSGGGYRLRTYWHPFNASAPKKNLDSSVRDFIPGRWYHVASVFDRTLNEVRIYLDGVRVATQSNAFSPGDVIFDGRRALTLGGGQKDRHCLSNTRIYSRALSDSDIQARYVIPGNPPRFLESSIAFTVHTDLGIKRSLWSSIWTGTGGAPAFSKVSGPAWLSVDANGELTGTPGTSDLGSTIAVIQMSNSHGSSDLIVNLTVVSSQLRARWHFDEGSGTTAADSSGNGKTAALSGATWKVPSREGASSLGVVGGSGQYVQAPFLSTTGGFTIAAWINPATRSGKDTIISQKGSYAFKLVGNTLELGIPSAVNQNSGNLGINSNQWRHVVVTYQPNDPEGIKFYIDGALRVTRPAGTFNQSTHPTLIGKSSDWVNDDFDGGLDDIRVYGSILSKEEILTMAGSYPTYTAPVIPTTLTRSPAVADVAYHDTLAGSATDVDPSTTFTFTKVSGPAWLTVAADGTLSGTPASSDVGTNSFTVRVNDPTGLSDATVLTIPVNQYLAAHWKVDEGTGTTSIDSSGTEHDLTLENTAAWGASRVGSSSLFLSGSTTTVPYARAAAVNTSLGVTLSLWIYPTSLSGQRTLITQTGSYSFRTNGTGLLFGISGINSDTGSGVLVANQWQHVAVSFKPNTAGGVRFYVNGILKTTGNTTLSIPQNSSSTLIGVTSGTTTSLWAGRMDDLRIHSAPMTDGEVLALYNSYPGYTAPSFTNDPASGVTWGADGPYVGTLAGSATDPDAGTTLSYSKVSGPAWMTVAADGTLGGTPTGANVGVNSFTVQVTDNTGQTDTAVLNISIIGNAAPVFTSNPVNGNGATEDSGYSASLSSHATDANGDARTFSKVSGPAWLNVASNGALSGTPSNEDVGANAFAVKVTDVWGTFGTATLNIAVANANDAPVFTADPILKADALCLVAYSDSLNGEATDMDVGDTLMYSKVSGPAWLSVASDGTLSGTPADSDSGLNSFVVRVTDSDSATTTAALQIKVTGIAWSNRAGGSWPTAGNWNGEIVASGANKIANFATLDLTADTTVSLNGARTIGHLTFGDTTPSHNWIVNTGSGGPLTLDVASGRPLIKVLNQTATLSAAMAGNDGLTKAGPGTLVLSSANTYTGGTTISEGILAIGNVGALGNSGVTLGNGSTLRVNYISGSPTLANTLTVAADDSAIVDVVGSGVPNNTLTLGTGAITLDGTLRVTRSAGSNGATNFSRALTGSGTLEVGNTQAGAVPISTSGLQGRCTFASPTAYAGFTGNIHVLNGGNLFLSPGTLTGQDVNIDSGGYLSLVDGLTTVIDNLTGNGSITKNAGGTAILDVASGNFSGVIAQNLIGGTGGVSLVKSGVGTLTLSGANTYTTTTTVRGGILIITGSLAPTVTTVETGTLAGTGTLGGAVTVQGGGTIAPGVDGIGTLTLASKALTLSGTTVMEVTQNASVVSNDKIAGITSMTYGGHLTVSQLDTEALSAGSSFVLFSATSYSGNFSTFTLPTLDEGLVWDTTGLLANGTIAVNRVPVAGNDTFAILEDESTLLSVLDNDTDFDSTFLEIESVTQGEHGVVTIEEHQIRYTPETNWFGMDEFTYTLTDTRGGTAVATVTVTVAPDNDDPVFGPLAEDSAAEDSAFSGSVAGDASDIDSPGVLTFSKVSGPAWLSVASDGTLSGIPLNGDVGANHFVLRVRDTTTGEAEAPLTVNVSNTNDAPTFAADPFTKLESICYVAYSGSIAGDAGDVDEDDTFTFSRVSGPSWLSVASNGALSGTPMDSDCGLNSFVMRVTDASNASTTATLQIMVTGIAWSNPAGGSWTTTGNWNGGVIASGADKIANFATLDLAANATVTLDGARTVGHLTFGDTTASHDWILNTGSAGPLTLDVTTGSPLITVLNQTATLGAVLAGNDGLIKTGPGTLVLGAANTYTGGTTITDGTLAIAHIGALGSGNTLAVPSGSTGTLDLILNGNLTLNTGTINVGGTLRTVRSSGSAGSTVINGGLSGAGILQIDTSPGPVTTSPFHRTSFGTSTTAFDNFTGSIEVLGGGNLGLFNGTLTSANSNNVTIASGGYVTLLTNTTTYVGALNGNGTITKNAAATNATLSIASGNFSGVISQTALAAAGAVIVTKAGTGTLTLSGANTYTGATTVSGGTLVLTGSLANTTTTVQSGGTLGGTGILGGAVTVQSGGTLAPGVDDTGTLTLSSKSLALSGTSSMEIGRTGSTLSNDKISGITTVTYGGTLQVSNVGGDALQAGDSFQLFSATTRSGSFTTVSLPTLGEGLLWNTSNLATSGTISVAATGALVVDPYLVWAGAHGLDGSSDDPDHDGTGNLLEFYLDSNPMAVDGSILPLTTVNATHVVLSFKRRDDAEAHAGTELVQWGSDLTGWSDVILDASSSVPDADGIVVEVTENGAAPDEITVSIPRALAAGGKLFARLKVNE